MTAKRDYAASITTTGLDGTGLTDEITRKLYSRRGSKYMAIVELVVDVTSDKRDGTHKVQLAIAGLEVVVDSPDMDEHLRGIQRTLHQNRGIHEGQLAIEDSLEPTVKDHIERGAMHRPHPFLPVDAADDNPICDVCGGLETAPVHNDDSDTWDTDDEDADDEDADDEHEGPGPTGELDDDQDDDQDDEDEATDPGPTIPTQRTNPFTVA